MSNWQEMDKKYLFTNTVRWSILPVKGKGSYLWDENGKKYLDLVGGWAVCCLGHSHPVMTKALTAQSKILVQCGPQSCNIPQLHLAELLVKISCCNRVFFAATANSNLTALMPLLPLIAHSTAGRWR